MMATYINQNTLLFINVFRIRVVLHGLDAGFILILKTRKLKISCSYRKSCFAGHPAQSVVSVSTTLSLLVDDELLCEFL
jgi:hypothetical protein